MEQPLRTVTVGVLVSREPDGLCTWDASAYRVMWAVAEAANWSYAGFPPWLKSHRLQQYFNMPFTSQCLYILTRETCVSPKCVIDCRYPGLPISSMLYACQWKLPVSGFLQIQFIKIYFYYAFPCELYSRFICKKISLEQFLFQDMASSLNLTNWNHDQCLAVIISHHTPLKFTTWECMYVWRHQVKH